MKLSTEENVKINIVLSYLNSLGFKEDELSFENSFYLYLGRSVYKVDTLEQRQKAQPRLDILVTRNNVNLFVIEVKSDLITITKEEIEQATSYAKLVHPVAPFTIITNGKEFHPKSPRDAIKNGIAFVTEDRKKSGLVLCLPVYENINLVNAQRPSFAGYLNWKKLKANALVHRESLNIRVSKIEQIVESLSGGNQQKVALAKWLDFSPKVIIFDEPTRGIDIGAKTEIYLIMGELAAKGAAVVMVSSELPELISVADRIMVLQEGRMKGILSKQEANQENVMSLATQKMQQHPCAPVEG